MIAADGGAATTAAPRTSALDRPTAMRLASDEYTRFVDQLRELSPEDWHRPTPCPGWDVHAMVAHVLGMADLAASVPEQLRQTRAAKKAGGLMIDALTSLQVAKHVHRSDADLVARLAVVGPRAAAGRRRTPSLVRRFRLGEQPVDETGTQTETWTVGYLTDTILTRDTWMHRSDIAAATGRPMTLTAEHDGVFVADVVQEWAGRHGQAYTLELTGPAGGQWGDGGGQHVLDAVEFCRIVSGRGTGTGLLATRVPF